MKPLLPLLSLLGAVLLSGCQTTMYQTSLRPEEAAEYSATSPEEGYLVGSFSYTANPPSFLGLAPPRRYTQYGFFLQGISKPGFKGDIGLNYRGLGRMPPNDFTLQDGGGRVFVIPLAAGRYEFYDFLLFENAGQVQTTWKSRNPYSIPIEIKKGEALYIGEIRTVHLYGKNFFGLPISDGGYFVALPEKERDIPLLHANFPFLRSVPVAEQVLDVTPIYGPRGQRPLEATAESAPVASTGSGAAAPEQIWSQRAQ